MSSSVRIPPLPVADWTKEAYDALAKLGPAGSLEVAEKSNLFMTLVNHPTLAVAYLAFGGHLLVSSSLPARLREIITLRVASRYKAEYEWYQHVVMGKRIGLTDAEIDATKKDIDAAAWSKEERCALRAADQLCEHSKINGDTWAELAGVLDRKQLMDFVFTVGNYVMLAWALNAFGVETEPESRVSEHPLD